METCRWTGAVTELVGLLVESKGPAAAMGDFCEINTPGRTLIRTQVIGFRDGKVLSMPLEETGRTASGGPSYARAKDARMEAGMELLGRVIDGFGKPMDGWAADRREGAVRAVPRRRGRSSANRSASRWSPAFEPSTAC